MKNKEVTLTIGGKEIECSSVDIGEHEVFLSNKEKITIKYHQHLEGTEPEGMMYFTLEDVHKCMAEYYEVVRKAVRQAEQARR